MSDSPRIGKPIEGPMVEVPLDQEIVGDGTGEALPPVEISDGDSASVEDS